MKNTLKKRTYYVPELSGSNYNEIEEILGQMSGVQSPGINIITNELRIYYYPEFISVEVCEDALKKAGFTLELMSEE